MINKVYFFQSDVTNYCSFIQDYPDGERSIISRSMMQDWDSFDDNYHPIILELRRNDFGKKNYQFDLSSALNPFFIISEIALDKLGDIFTSRGQVLPVITESKKKKFFGYYSAVHHIVGETSEKANSVRTILKKHSIRR